MYAGYGSQGLELRDTAEGVKRSANGKAGIQEQERIRFKAANVDACRIPKFKSRTASRNKLQRRQPNRLKRMIAGLNGSRRTDRDVNLAAFEHRQQRRPKRLAQLDPHVRATFGVTGQEDGQDTIDRLRRGNHLQDTSVGSP
jgi:hypothetical protein